MSSTKSSPKHTQRVSSDSAVLSFDLFSNLTYMSALSTGEVPRDVIFQHAIAQPYKTAIYFKQVYLLTKRLGFEYSRSFQLVSRKAGAATVKACCSDSPAPYPPANRSTSPGPGSKGGARAVY